MIRNETIDHPDYTEWDRFAQCEYQRLAMEEENQENVNNFDILKIIYIISLNFFHFILSFHFKIKYFFL